jgi:replicative DNA helicase
MATAEVKALNAILKTADRSALYGSGVDDLFGSYGDVWEHIKDYHSRYNALPSIDSVVEKFPDFEVAEVDSNARYYMDNLKAEFRRNRIERILTMAGKELSPETSESTLTKLLTSLGQLHKYSNSGRALDLMDFDTVEQRHAETRRKAAEMGGTPGVPTGIDLVDSCMVLGMQAGDVTSIIGYPGRGKSAVAALITAKVMTSGFKPLVISAEMTAEAVQDRVYTILGKGTFSNSELMLGQMDIDDFRSFKTDHEKCRGLVLDDMGDGVITPNSIRAQFDLHHPDIIILDYMQLLYDNRMTDDMTGRMRNLSMEIKQLAKACAVPVIVISSATPPDGGRVDGPPNVERTAWSRQLSYDSTVCMAVHRIEGTNFYHIVCAKNRYGPMFEGYLEWDMDRGIITERFDIEED